LPEVNSIGPDILVVNVPDDPNNFSITSDETNK